MSDVIITSGPCPCCGAGCFSGRTKGGFANTGCGWSSFERGPPGSREKFFRTKTLGGSICEIGFQENTCVSLDGGSKRSYSGSCSYSTSCVAGVVQCDFGGAGQEVLQQGAEATDCSVFDRTETNPACQIGPFGVGVDYSTTETVYTAAGSGICIPVAFGKGVKSTGTATETLSGEVTDGVAKAELLACAAWTAYGTDPSDLTAAWSINVDGSGFVYKDAQWKIASSGLVVGATYQAAVKYYRRTYGVGPFVLWRTDTVSGTADGTGALLINGDVPNDEGYETLAACDCVLTKL